MSTVPSNFKKEVCFYSSIFSLIPPENEKVVSTKKKKKKQTTHKKTETIAKKRHENFQCVQYADNEK